MKARKSKKFPLSAEESDYFDDNQEKITLLRCSFSGKGCNPYLPKINKYFLESSKHFRNKNYLMAVEALNNANSVTFNMNRATCSRCVQLFRSTINKSLDAIRGELKEISVEQLIPETEQLGFLIGDSTYPD